MVYYNHIRIIQNVKGDLIVKLNKNVILLLGSIAFWFIASILLILIGSNAKTVTILFSILSVGLVLMIYRVLYLEFYKKYHNPKNRSK